MEDLVTSDGGPRQRWLQADDRVLVTGCGGWFGRTFLNMLGDHPHVLPVGSPRDRAAIQWDDDTVRQFAPTVVANFAFHTRDRLADMGRQRYVLENAELTRRLVFALRQDSVRIGLTVSSGAAVAADARAGLDSPELYGALKASEEAQALALASDDRSVVVARAYSVSGPFVRRVHDYALSDLVAQAVSGDITITSTQPVYRRYASVSDLLNVSLVLAGGGWSGVMDSGGDLIEMQELSEVVRDVVNPTARIRREALKTHEPSVYASDNVTWTEGCRRAQVEPMSLPVQIRAVENYIRTEPQG